MGNLWGSNDVLSGTPRRELCVVIVAGPISLAVQLVFAAAVIIVFWLLHTKSGEATCAHVPE